MKHLLITIALIVLVGCGESQQSTPSPEVKPAEPFAEATKPEPPTSKAPDISIYEAVRDGKIKDVKKYLAAGGNVNAKNNLGDSPLHTAANYGHTEIANLLIAAGADVNAKDDLGDYPLHHVGNKEIAELLIAEGVDVNAKDDEGNTALHGTAFMDQEEIAGLLIDKGAEVNA